MGFLDGSDGKESAGNAGDLGLSPGLGRFPGGGHDNPLQYSCLENPRDGGAWKAAIYGVPQSRTRLKRLSSSSSVIIKRGNLETETDMHRERVMGRHRENAIVKPRIARVY